MAVEALEKLAEKVEKAKKRRTSLGFAAQVSYF
jgi:hypothetical protein